MELRSEFKLSPLPRVTAAQIGINSLEWVFTKDKDEENAKSIMAANKYDVLPIKNGDGLYEEYFATREWNNYSALNLNQVDQSNTIYYSTGLRDLIKRFNKDRKYFYFLSDYNQIVGLVSFANLSCQAVYNYLYFIISSIETGVSDLLNKRVKEHLVIQLFSKRAGNDHLKRAIDRFINDKKEHSFYSYLDFKDLGLVAREYEALLSGKEKKLVKYHSKFESTYNELRLKVMHPVKTLLTTRESIEQIDELFDDYEEIMRIVTSEEGGGDGG